ncbi:hypothetical protein VDR38_20705, partial [Xanthomonas campestris pv. campestris]|nr:hypothetical protein [Xanthomonas campestris pv. campestris]
PGIKPRRSALARDEAFPGRPHRAQARSYKDGILALRLRSGACRCVVACVQPASRFVRCLGNAVDQGDGYA